ncbi:flavin reductase family protein [Pyrobaculum neutrophilum]|uniref:Flavin reductase domain protein FMN-binding n=1 Tax=Pyrobaculum neutrophilum (strain DSM 2338 / JCM 9278 / NBRC 100436 / V24Sta) TaxID=444157 RepID=B1Y8W8_PYRNV|nr:flavin reductase family protein [Pyrobaculum neutrophilum]ACB40197.1 flavin reductase domain protein FMN-binding [Pyrobaculum neutrophilum V24Sta]
MYQGKFYRLLHPRPTLVVVSRCPGGRLNLMPASWNTPVSEDPPTVAVAVERSSYTHECLKHHRRATLNVLPLEAADLIYKLGTVSGRDVDKAAQFGVAFEKSEKVDVPRVAGAIAGYEAEVYMEVEVGEVTLFIFKVLHSWAAPGVADQWGYDFKRVNIPLHGAGRAFYGVDPRPRFVKKT